jgi:hypothetical protein
MACCNYTIQPFALQSTTTVPYVGDRPTIDVVYLQTDGTFLQMGVFTQINFTTTDVIINHGGPASGLVKILQ